MGKKTIQMPQMRALTMKSSETSMRSKNEKRRDRRKKKSESERGSMCVIIGDSTISVLQSDISSLLHSNSTPMKRMRGVYERRVKEKVDHQKKVSHIKKKKSNVRETKRNNDKRKEIMIHRESDGHGNNDDRNDDGDRNNKNRSKEQVDRMSDDMNDDDVRGRHDQKRRYMKSGRVIDDVIRDSSGRIQVDEIENSENRKKRETQHCCLEDVGEYIPTGIHGEKWFREKRYLTSWEGYDNMTYEHVSHFDTQYSKQMIDNYINEKNSKGKK